MAAGKFKAQCLAVMDEVELKREPVLLTKKGRPVAKLVPVPFEGEDPIFGFYRGKIEILGDIVGPTQTEEETEAYLEREAAHCRGDFEESDAEAALLQTETLAR